MAKYRKRSVRPKNKRTRKYRKRDDNGSVPPKRKYSKRPLPGRRDVGTGAPSYVSRPRDNAGKKGPKNFGKFYITAESTGMQIRKLGSVKIPNYNYNPIKSIGNYGYHNINQWVMVSAQGIQNVDYGECAFTREQLIGTTDSSRFNRQRWADDPFQLNPYTIRPNNQVYTVTQDPILNPTARNDVLYIKSIKYTLEMLNMTILPQNSKIYFLCPNYDTNINPIDQWVSILASKAEGQIASVPQDDLLDVNAVAGASTATDPRASPFVHGEFRNNWTTLQSIEVILQAGEQANFEFTVEINKVMSRDTLVNIRQNQFLRGITIFPLFITNAGLAGIAPEEGFEAAEVAYGEVKVGIMMNQQINFGALPTSRKSFERTFPGDLRNVTVGAVAEAQRTITDEDVIAAANTRL